MPAASKRTRDEPAAPPTPILVLSGGHAEAKRTIDKYRNHSSCDAHLRSSCGTDFHAHRLVLSAKSEYFEGLWSTASEWSDGDAGAVQLGQVSAAALSGCLEWMYVGKVPVLTEGAIVTLLDAASYLQIDNLVEATADALRVRLSPSTAMDAWAAAQRHERPILAAEAQAVACRHFEHISASAEWENTSPSLVHALLADETLAVSKEESVYCAALRWIKARAPPLSTAEVAAMLAHVRFPQCACTFFSDTVRTEPLLSTPEGQAMLLDAYSDAHYGGSEMRRSILRYVVVIGSLTPSNSQGDTGIDSHRVDRFDTVTNAWEEMPPLPAGQGRQAIGLAAFGEKLYAVGGRNLTSRLDSVLCFDRTTNVWGSVAPMSNVRSGVGVAVLGGKMYAVGGRDNEGCHNSMERFDLATELWETAVLPTMATARATHSVAAFDGKLYAVGGLCTDTTGNDSFLSSMERFDPSTNVWETMPPMPPPARCNLVAVVLGGRLYVLGGKLLSQNFDLMQRFDPTTNTWEAMPSMPACHGPCQAAAFGGFLYVMGGAATNSPFRNKAMERFNPATKVWEAMPDMPNVHKHGAAAVI